MSTESLTVPLSSELQMEETPKPRLTAFDQVKGVAILCVILIHVTSHASNAYFKVYEDGWWAYRMILQTVSFAVPVFLCASAFLWCLSLSRKDEVSWKDFFRKRGLSILHPYIVFTLISFLVEVKFVHPPANRVVAMKLLGSDLLWGKAMYHLYFMVILLQFLILFPLFYWTLKKTKAGFWATLAAAFLIECVIYEVQHLHPFLPYPATMAIWHFILLLPAMWLGMNWDKGREGITTSLLPCILVVLAAGAYFLWGECYEYRNLSHWGMGTNLAVEIYGLGMFICLTALFLRATKPPAWLTWLGSNSLPIYLLHPYVLAILTIGRFERVWKDIPAQGIPLYVATVAITIGLTYAFRFIQLDRILWGPLLRPHHKPIGAESASH